VHGSAGRRLVPLISPKKAEAADLVAQTASQEATNDGLRTQLEVLKAQAKDLPKKQADLARVQTKILTTRLCRPSSVR
jgi:hypothetical protein